MSTSRLRKKEFRSGILKQFLLELF
jgi:hypothetical protein